MPEKFYEVTMSPAVRAAQKQAYGRAWLPGEGSQPDTLGPDETDFIAARDSFYISTINAAGWPYIQHRGGAAGFLRVLSPTSLAFADFRGNRQLLSTGNLAENNRVALFLMDYRQRTRLKILGHARIEDAKDHPQLRDDLAPAATQRLVERIFFIDVVGFDWNCPQHITPRYTIEDVNEVVAPLRARIAELEAKLKAANDA